MSDLQVIGRFAPSTTGHCHPGTLLSALLCWLDLRSRGGIAILRLEDLDPERCQPVFAESMRNDLAWFGLDFDIEEIQSEHSERHADALDRLAEAGHLYRCRCTRKELREHGTRGSDGSVRYPGTCREQRVRGSEWRDTSDVLRVMLPSRTNTLQDEAGVALDHISAADLGDPVVRRRDGAVAYQLAGVVDDGARGITHVVRGRDLAPSTATQIALQKLLALPQPSYHHHLLLLEQRGEKLAKLHGSVSVEALRTAFDANSLCGVLAQAAGLRDAATPTTPVDLLADFSWDSVRHTDRLFRFSEGRIELGD